ncbi:hypothetical protein BDP55DRAFT_553569 [Colletotrichum godetiae]|uniref:2EXR domain-containing protein n=1 Tax=Colletotrichum godetiae TaxID=1209918 RepID=A0AAJ0AJK0_9PEZI|nr:uncharacterized protein BDP55DRAFT_553569 [Colletotrichum godetiae]KAK1675071.1 hypothetical protein BDP55DRAFT_553569 [Colletotrichum godetiae]
MPFTKFAELPAELRLKVWNEAAAGPSIHIFDVCFPSWRGTDRSRRAFQSIEGNISEDNHARWTKYRDCVFLDALEAGPAELARQTRIARHMRNPSVYKQRQTMRLVCSEASAAVERRLKGRSMNSVYLPGRNQRIQYDNEEDVLLLRFGDGGALTDLSHGVLFGEFEASGVNNLTEVLEGPWSAEMAETLRDAQLIALDIAETWTPATVGAAMFEEVAYLACCIQRGLRVLYLVDHCPGRCTRCEKQNITRSQLQTRGELYDQLHSRDMDAARLRPADVIHGVGKTYREVFDLEGMGWSDEHPIYMFARVMDEMIRNQQADADTQDFEGIRVLLVEDDELEGVDNTTMMDCFPDGRSEVANEVLNMNLRWSS